MRTGRSLAANSGWIIAGLVLLAGVTPLSATAADRLVFCEEFTATW